VLHADTLAGVRLGTRPLAALSALCTVALGACGDTVQDRPIPHNILESLLIAPYPVYWLGNSFQGTAITESAHDPSGAFSVQYGDCVEGGQGTCVPPLRIITSPDNSFLPGGSTARSSVRVRGVEAALAEEGKTIMIPTSGVVVGIYAENARLAAYAAQRMVPINSTGVPGGPLPGRRADTGYAETPLPAQTPSPLRALH
jgi:hypothetical protein